MPEDEEEIAAQVLSASFFSIAGPRPGQMCRCAKILFRMLYRSFSHW
jgi:hypothetical protein